MSSHCPCPTPLERPRKDAFGQAVQSRPQRKGEPPYSPCGCQEALLFTMFHKRYLRL